MTGKQQQDDVTLEEVIDEVENKKEIRLKIDDEKIRDLFNNRDIDKFMNSLV